jgi:hypothetical protein
MRYKQAPRDENHARIALDLGAAGFSVFDSSKMGRGFPDMVIARNSVIALVEVKRPYVRRRSTTLQKPATTKLEATQRAFIDSFKGPVIVAYTSGEVIRDFNLLLKRRQGWAQAC